MENDKDVVFLFGDLGWQVFDGLREKYPARVMNAGISEDSMIGMASGLALAGKKVYCYTMTAFMLYRGFEFIRNDLAYNNNKAVLVTVGSGFQDYPREGATHNAIEDISIGTAIPNLTVLSPSDGKETEILIDMIDEIKTPVWLRLAKASDYSIHDKHKNLKIGKPLTLQEGDDLTIVSTGQITKTAIEVAARLKSENLTPKIIECPTLKPLDTLEISKSVSDTGMCVVIEESTGGLANIVSRAVAQNSLKSKFISFAIPDTFVYGFGSKEWMLQQAGLDADTIYKKLKKEIL